jgi:hypothetical protein
MLKNILSSFGSESYSTSEYDSESSEEVVRGNDFLVRGEDECGAVEQFILKVGEHSKSFHQNLIHLFCGIVGNLIYHVTFVYII